MPVPTFPRLLVAAAAAALFAQPVAAQRRVQIGSQLISLEGYGIEKGDPKAPMWIVELADFGCGYCAKFAFETAPALDSQFTKPGKLYWRYVPFVLGSFPNAQQAAEGALCAAEQGKFWPMHDKLYEKRKEWMGSSSPVVRVARMAAEVGVDGAAYGRCVRGKAVGERLRRNNELARSMMVRGTPTFVINGELVQGALPKDVFVKGLEAVHRSVTSGARAPGR